MSYTLQAKNIKNLSVQSFISGNKQNPGFCFSKKSFFLKIHRQIKTVSIFDRRIRFETR